MQNIDVPETLLSFFDVEIPADMQGFDLEETIARDTPVRDYAMFGMHGAQVNITDGRYLYMRDPVAGNKPLYNYTLMPTHMRCMFSVKELENTTMAPAFAFTKGVPLMKISAEEDLTGDTSMKFGQGTVLYDLEKDPYQMHPIDNPEVAQRMVQSMIRLMEANDAPAEQYVRLGLK